MVSSRVSSPVLRAVHLSRSYPSTRAGGPPVELFRGLDLTVAPGEMVGIIGKSGAGKSSLLHLLAGLDRPSSGEIWLGSTPVHTLSPDMVARLRNRSLGFVWQFHHLLPEFTAAENVALPLIASGTSRAAALDRAKRWLTRVELASRLHHSSGELSGGEQQRVAIARALVHEPAILLADEPTGDLDGETAAHLFTLLERLCREQQLAMVLVTHNLDLAGRCDRALELARGRLEAVSLQRD